MKTKLLIVSLLVAAAVSLTSCTAQKGGCKASHGYVGYGGR